MLMQSARSKLPTTPRVGSQTPSRCPFCGQALIDKTAVGQLRSSIAAHDRELRNRLVGEAKAHAREMAVSMLAKERSRLQAEVRADQAKRMKALEAAAARLQSQNADLERRLERLSAGERGEITEATLFESLVRAFPGDAIKRRGKGGDIVQTVRYEAGRRIEEAGIIVFERKDTLHWSEAFIAQLRKAGELHRTPNLILVTTALPKRGGEIAVRDGVVIVAPRYATQVADFVRRMVIAVHHARLTAEGRAQKTSRLFGYLTSEDFRRDFGWLAQASDPLASLLRDEKRAHERFWSQRDSIYAELGRRSAAVDEAIRLVLEEPAASGNGKVIKLGDAQA